jgi:hypothetical protein
MACESGRFDSRSRAGDGGGGGGGAGGARGGVNGSAAAAAGLCGRCPVGKFQRRAGQSACLACSANGSAQGGGGSEGDGGSGGGGGGSSEGSGGTDDDDGSGSSGRPVRLRLRVKLAKGLTASAASEAVLERAVMHCAHRPQAAVEASDAFDDRGGSLCAPGSFLQARAGAAPVGICLMCPAGKHAQKLGGAQRGGKGPRAKGEGIGHRAASAFSAGVLAGEKELAAALVVAQAQQAGRAEKVTRDLLLARLLLAHLPRRCRCPGLLATNCVRLFAMLREERVPSAKRECPLRRESALCEERVPSRVCPREELVSCLAHARVRR